MERAKGFEPSTPTLARSCSTPELHPHPKNQRLGGRWARHLCQNASGIATIAGGGSATRKSLQAAFLRTPPCTTRVEIESAAIMLYPQLPKR
jgi:hypothetical protein